MAQKKNSSVKSDKVSSSIKKELNEESSNKKIIIIALILALLIAGVAYLKSCNSNKEDSEKKNPNEEIKQEIRDEDLEDLEEETSNDNNYYVQPISSENENKVDETDEVEEIYYSLTFESNGGTKIEKQILGLNEVSEIKIPTRENWIFAGWFEDKELTSEYIFGTHLTEDKVVYAKWVKNIKYIYMQEELEDIATVGLNETIPLLSGEDERFELEDNQELGWFIYETDGDGIVDTEILPNTLLTEELANKFDDTIVLHAKLLSKFEMTFNYYVSSEDTDTTDSLIPKFIEKTVVEGRNIPFEEVNSEIREKYPEFIDKEFGWYYYDNNQLKIDMPSDSKADINIINVYMGEVVTIKYYDSEELDEDDQPTLITSQKVVKNSHIKEENILIPEEKEGKTFLGWFTESENPEDFDELTSETVIDDDKWFVGVWIDESDESILLTIENNNSNSQEEVENEEEINTEELVPDINTTQDNDDNVELDNQEPDETISE